MSYSLPTKSDLAGFPQLSAQHRQLQFSRQCTRHMEYLRRGNPHTKEVYHKIRENTRPRYRQLETGRGMSTVVVVGEPRAQAHVTYFMGELARTQRYRQLK